MRRVVEVCVGRGSRYGQSVDARQYRTKTKGLLGRIVELQFTLLTRVTIETISDGHFELRDCQITCQHGKLSRFEGVSLVHVTAGGELMESLLNGFFALHDSCHDQIWRIGD